MADNFGFDPGTTIIFRSKDRTSVHYQVIELNVGGASEALLSLPAAAALADGAANPTTHIMGAGLLMWNGSTWDRVPGTTANGLDVDVTRMAALVTGTATIGAVKTAESGRTILHAKVALAASQTGATILDPTAGKKFCLKKLVTSCKTAGDVYFYDDTDDSAHAIGPALTLAIGGGWTETWDADDPYRSETVDHILKYTSGAGLTGSVYLDYWEE